MRSGGSALAGIGANLTERRSAVAGGNAPRAGEVTTSGAAICTRWELMVGLLFVGLLTLLYFLPLLGGKTLTNFLTPEQYHAIGAKPGFVYPQSDQAEFVYPHVVLQTNAWRDGTVPLWNPYSLGGTPLLANAGSGVMYPLRIVLALLVTPVLNHELFLVIHVLASGMAMFLLLKEFRLRLLAAMLGSAAWMFVGWNGSVMQLETFMPIGAGIPAALLLVHRGARARSWRMSAAAGIPLGLMVLGGNVQLAAVAFAVSGLYAAGLALKPPCERSAPRAIDLRRLVTPALTLGVGVGLAAVTLLPTVLIASQGARDTVPYAVFERTHTISVSLFKHVASGGPPTFSTLNYASVFVGIVPLVLALVGVFRRRPGASLGRWLAIGTFLLAIGAPVLTWLAYYLVPGVSRLTTTGYLLWLFCLGVVILAALGLDAVLEASARLAKSWRSRSFGLAPYAPAIGVLVGVLAVGVTTWQLVDYARFMNPPFTARKSAYFTLSGPAAAALQRDEARRAPGESQRILGFSAFYGEQSLVYPFEVADGYDNVTPNRVRNFWRVIGGEPVDAALKAGSIGTFLPLFTPRAGGDLLFRKSWATNFALLPRAAITTLIAAPSAASELEDPTVITPLGLKRVYAGSDVSIFQIDGQQPRAWVVHQAVVEGNESQALRRFADPQFDYRNRMIVEPDQHLGVKGHSTVRGAGSGTIANRDSISLDRTAFSVNTRSPGWLVMADMYAPGWRVTVNGRDDTLLRADYTLRAVRVPAGRSRIVLSYRPPGFEWGLFLSGLTVLGLVALAAVSKQARNRRLGRAAVPVRATLSEPQPWSRTEADLG